MQQKNANTPEAQKMQLNQSLSSGEKYDHEL